MELTEINTGNFAKLCHVTKKTLYFYDEIGLLKPVRVAKNGYRFYDVMQCDKMATIKMLQELGASLDEIQSFFKKDVLVEQAEFMREKRLALDEKMKLLEKRQCELDFLIKRMNEFMKIGSGTVFFEQAEAKRYGIVDQKLKKHFVVNSIELGDFTAEQPVTVTKKDVKAEYTLTMPADKTVNAGEAVAVPVTLSHTGDETTFHAADMVFTYDTDKLTYVSVDVPDSNCSVDAATAGTIHVQAYGEAKNLGKAFTLNFTVNASATGTATVTATSAKIDKSANAVAKDAPEAQLLDAETVLTIKAVHNVTLDPIFTGDLTVEDGADYTFTEKDSEHYDYSDVKAMVDGKDVEVVDNGDGTYTVKNVTGDLTVTGKRTAKQYPITVEGNAKSCIRFADTVPYGTDYEFAAEELETDKYDYTLTMTINGKPYTPKFDDSYVSFMNTYFYTIKGDAITGAIHITFTQTEKGGAETTTVNFTGSGAADVAGGNPQTATTGADFTFTVNKDAKYNYTVKLGNEVLTGTNGSYTIPGAKVVSGTITVTVEKTVSTQGVKVQKYVKLENQQSVWLVTVEADPGANNVYTYSGERMFKTTKYGTNGTYAYLVIAPTLSVEDAAAQLSITAGEAAGTVSYGGDVNGSGVVDINDAQLVYDMYNAHYSDFTTVSMYKFLCADIADDTPEGSTLLNVSDAVAVISKINQQ